MQIINIFSLKNDLLFKMEGDWGQACEKKTLWEDENIFHNAPLEKCQE